MCHGRQTSEVDEDPPSEDRDSVFRAGLARGSAPSPVLGRASKADGGVGKVCPGKRGGISVS